MLPDHPPEVVHRVLQGTLGQNVLVALLVPLWEEGRGEGGGRGGRERGEGGGGRKEGGRGNGGEERERGGGERGREVEEGREGGREGGVQRKGVI